MSDKVAILQVKTPPALDAEAIKIVEEMLAAMKAGTVTAVVVLAKENGFTRWSCVRAYTNQDRYNLLGQIAVITKDLVDMQEVASE